MVELESEGVDERHVVEQDVARFSDEVGGNAAAGEEAPEVDRGTLDGAASSARPLDLGDLQSVALRCLGDGLGLEDVGVERGRANAAEGITVLVEGVVGRSVDARPGAGRQRVPPGAGIRGRLRQHPVSGGLGPVLQERCHGRHEALSGVPGNDVLAQPVGREVHRLARRRLALAGRWSRGGGDGEGGHEQRDDGQ
jgi:hypothetical protein